MQGGGGRWRRMRTTWWLALGLALAAGAARAQAPNGGELFAGYCAPCHGREGRGDGRDADLFDPRPPDLRPLLARHSDDDLVERIRHRRPLGLARDPKALAARAGDTELLVGHLHRLPTLDWQRVERGHELYVDHCEQCHGAFGHSMAALPTGVTRMPQDLSDPGYQRATSDAALLERIRHGHRGMPAIPGVESSENGAALVAFLRLLSPGYELYSRFCAGCHGEDGRGPGPGWAVAKRPSVVFDARYFEAKDGDALRRDVWHMLADESGQMPHMSRVLRPREVRAILAWLRAPHDTRASLTTGPVACMPRAAAR